MASDRTDLLTAANIAKALGVSDGKVKKAIQTLSIKPQAKKGVCNYPGLLRADYRAGDASGTVHVCDIGLRAAVHSVLQCG